MAFSVLQHRDELMPGAPRHFIDGKWIDGVGESTHAQVHGATHEEVAVLPVANEAEVDTAVRAARRAFDEGPWPRMGARERQRILSRAAQLIAADVEHLNRLQALDNGLPVSYTNLYQLSAEIVADTLEHYAGWIDKISGETLPSYRKTDMFTMTIREPLGVVAGIIPWNAPPRVFSLKVAPALAAGCTVVLKPSENASLSTIRLTELLAEAGLPEGVFNLVLGDGPTTGEALITHPQVDKVSFTGSRAVGRRILEVSGKDIKRVALELGGKSPMIIFPDAPDVAMAAAVAMGGVAMGLSGQGCVIMTRTLVHKDIYDEVVEAATNLTSIVKYGDPFDPATTSMPIITDKQTDRVMSLIDAGRAEGARLVTGGERDTEGELAAGNWIKPTLFADVDNKMTIAQEEIFGPVLAMVPFETEDEAIRLSNDTPYGLGASVWTSDIKRAMRCAKGIRAGTFGINAQGVIPNAPFGGYKQSGLGREGGRAGIEAFTEVKTVRMALGDGIV